MRILTQYPNHRLINTDHYQSFEIRDVNGEAPYYALVGILYHPYADTADEPQHTILGRYKEQLTAIEALHNLFTAVEARKTAWTLEPEPEF